MTRYAVLGEYISDEKLGECWRVDLIRGRNEDTLFGVPINCQGHSHPKLPVSPSCTQQLLSTKDGRTPVGCP